MKSLQKKSDNLKKKKKEKENNKQKMVLEVSPELVILQEASKMIFLFLWRKYYSAWRCIYEKPTAWLWLI